MKNILKEVLLFTLILFFFYFTLRFNHRITDTILHTSLAWLKNIVPILFPTFILIDVLTNSKIPYYFEKITGWNYIYFLSILSGSPSNAYMIKDTSVKKEKLLATTHYISLLFTLANLKRLYNTLFASVLLVCTIVTNFILILWIKPPKIKATYKEIPLYTCLLQSIKNTTNTLLSILGTILFFNILPIFLIKNIYLRTLLYCFCEITTGFSYLHAFSFPILFQLFCTCILLSFGGLCIIAQVKNIIPELNTKEFLKYRFYHFLILFSMILIFFFLCT